MSEQEVEDNEYQQQAEYKWDRTVVILGRWKLDFNWILDLLFPDFLEDLTIAQIFIFDFEAKFDDWYNFNLLDWWQSEKSSPIAWIANDYANFLTSQTDSNYVRIPIEAPLGVWSVIFGDVFKGYYEKQIYVFDPFVSTGKYVLEKILGTAYYHSSLSNSLNSSFLGFEPQCDNLFRSVLLKWTAIILALPMWLYTVLLFLVRGSFLFADFLLTFFVWLANFPVSIYIYVRNLLFDDLVRPFIPFFQEVYKWWYFIFVWPWVFFFWMFSIIFVFLKDLNLALFNLMQMIEGFVFGIFWFIFDWWNATITFPVLNFFLGIITWLPNLILTAWGQFLAGFFKPMDDICVWALGSWDHVGDFILAWILLPHWQPSFIEYPFAFPLLLILDWWESNAKYIL